MERDRNLAPTSIADCAFQDSDPACDGRTEALEDDDHDATPGDGGDEDNEAELRLVENGPSGPLNKTLSQKKRAEIAAFEVYLEKHQDQIHQASKPKEQSAEDKPVTWMIRGFEDHKIIESPRDYQVELFERAKSRNTIAVLDTGKCRAHPW